MIVHAVGETCERAHAPNTYAVVVESSDLDILAKKLSAGGIKHKVIVDPDVGPESLAIGIQPGPRSAVYPYVRSLALYGKEGGR